MYLKSTDESQSAVPPLRSMSFAAQGRQVAADKLHRPPQATPSTARPSPPTPDITSPKPQLHRPHLRIITNFSATAFSNNRTKSTQRPGTQVKSAPLYAQMNMPRRDTAVPPHDRGSPLQHASFLILSISPSRLGYQSPRGTGDTSHHGLRKRRLSDRFRNLFSGMIMRMKSPPSRQADFPSDLKYNIPSDEGGATPVEACSASSPPPRPYRSPGTASFLVTRQYVPLSGASASQSITSSTGTGVQRERAGEVYLAPPWVDISHFSSPSTLQSTLNASERAAGNAEAPDGSPGGHLGPLYAYTDLRGRPTMRRATSMPDLWLL